VEVIGSNPIAPTIFLFIVFAGFSFRVLSVSPE